MRGQAGFFDIDERLKDLPRRVTISLIGGEPAVGVLFKRFDAAVKACGYLAMGGHIIDDRRRS